MAGYWDALERNYRLLGVFLSSLSVHSEVVTRGVAVVRRLDEQLDCCGDLPGRRLEDMSGSAANRRSCLLDDKPTELVIIHVCWRRRGDLSTSFAGSSAMHDGRDRDQPVCRRQLRQFR